MIDCCTLQSPLSQVPYYQGDLITFDVVPSKLTFSVNYKSVILKVRGVFVSFPMDKHSVILFILNSTLKEIMFFG